jgi:dimeric dUTPase (all-alpha-NTP-PPase superfamily)
MKEKLLLMLSMQDSMNKKVHPHWVAQNFEWYRAAWIECGELMDHQGYKWWKKQSADSEQVKLEIIDIWHFALSSLFDGDKTIAAIADDIVAQLSGFSPLELSIHHATEQVAQGCLSNKRVCVRDFWQLLHAANMDFDTLYTAYVGKNVLNFFRQDNGYKDGSYQKQWQGREDNEHLAEIVASLDHQQSDIRDTIYNALAARYAKALAAANSNTTPA